MNLFRCNDIYLRNIEMKSSSYTSNHLNLRRSLKGRWKCWLSWLLPLLLNAALPIRSAFWSAESEVLSQRRALWYAKSEALPQNKDLQLWFPENVKSSIFPTFSLTFRLWIVVPLAAQVPRQLSTFGTEHDKRQQLANFNQFCTQGSGSFWIFRIFRWLWL